MYKTMLLNFKMFRFQTCGKVPVQRGGLMEVEGRVVWGGGEGGGGELYRFYVKDQWEEKWHVKRSNADVIPD